MPDALIELDRTGGSGLLAQLTTELRAAVRTGRLAAGVRLPSSRALAEDLGVSRGVVVEAYEQLVAEGFLVARRGSGTRVAAAAVSRPARSGAATRRAAMRPAARTAARTAALPAATGAAPGTAARTAAGNGAPGPAEAAPYDLRPGTPDLAAFPRSAWLAALRHSLATLPHSELGYADAAGVAVLRGELAGYLGRVRGTDAGAENVLVVNGVAQGLSLVLGVLARHGHGMIAVEDPAGVDIRRLVAGSGLEVVGVPVDPAGVRVDALARTGARAVLVTPAHQFPTGVVLSPERRAALVDWVRSSDAYIIEDDYDAEFRYDREPVGCLQGLAADRVVHLGSVSKSLMPGLRLGWAVLPDHMVEPLRDAKHHADHCSPVLEQHALRWMLGSGGYDRHLRAVRRRYRARRDALVGALAEYLPEARVLGIAAGLHVYVELPRRCDETAVEQAARQRGVLVGRVGPMRTDPASAPPAVVLAYARLPEARLVEAAALLAQAARPSRSGPSACSARPMPT